MREREEVAGRKKSINDKVLILLHKSGNTGKPATDDGNVDEELVLTSLCEWEASATAGCRRR